MKIQVLNDDGSVAFGYDTAMASEQTCPSVAETTAIAAALHDASAFLSSDHSTIASIRQDISAAIGRIEHELGAHPAFTWAQTTLSNAAAHLEHYVKGIWTEPPARPGDTIDARGVLIAGPGVQPPAA
jgi:hypothetical protein